ncbi:uncharacterized protein LOC126824513 isoform X2 [Patella vulgata]|uniref:uncharacterized protein LOC126824513 isoform X2 n=1 Tax=Patella vulgata TaxID=6465 RepID=UPI00217FA06E|nr:uncharacterized protein LOC126824513 isoform X2 [Patella vulgata]
MALNELSEFVLGSMLKFEQTIRSDIKSVDFFISNDEDAVIIKTSCDRDRSPDKTSEDGKINKFYPFLNSVINKVRSVLGKPVQDDNEVVDEGAIKPATSNRREKEILNETSTPAKKQKIFNNEDYGFRTKLLFGLLSWIIYSQLISPVRASDRPPVRAADRPPVRASDRPPVLGPDTCHNDRSNNPKNMKVTPGDNQTFRITFKCLSVVENIQVVFYRDNSSTAINVWKLYDKKGNQPYNPHFKGRMQIEVDLKNRKMKVTVNNITLQGRIVVWIDFPDGRIYIPQKKDESVVNSTTRPTMTTRKVNGHDRKAMNSAVPISGLTILAIIDFILFICGVALYIVVQILKTYKICRNRGGV